MTTEYLSQRQELDIRLWNAIHRRLEAELWASRESFAIDVEHYRPRGTRASRRDNRPMLPHPESIRRDVNNLTDWIAFLKWNKEAWGYLPIMVNDRFSAYDDPEDRWNNADSILLGRSKTNSMVCWGFLHPLFEGGRWAIQLENWNEGRVKGERDTGIKMRQEHDQFEIDRNSFTPPQPTLRRGRRPTTTPNISPINPRRNNVA